MLDSVRSPVQSLIGSRVWIWGWVLSSFHNFLRLLLVATKSIPNWIWIYPSTPSQSGWSIHSRKIRYIPSEFNVWEGEREFGRKNCWFLEIHRNYSIAESFLFSTRWWRYFLDYFLGFEVYLDSPWNMEGIPLPMALDTLSNGAGPIFLETAENE